VRLVEAVKLKLLMITGRAITEKLRRDKHNGKSISSCGYYRHRLSDVNLYQAKCNANADMD
jgi:hypothetical protein